VSRTKTLLTRPSAVNSGGEEGEYDDRISAVHWTALERSIGGTYGARDEGRRHMR